MARTGKAYYQEETDFQRTRDPVGKRKHEKRKRKPSSKKMRAFDAENKAMFDDRESFKTEEEEGSDGYDEEGLHSRKKEDKQPADERCFPVGEREF